MIDERPGSPTARARPVADAPADALAARGGELAQRWAIALILARPPGEMATVPLEEIAHVAPELCASIASALRSEDELARLVEDSGDSHPGVRYGPAGAPAGLSLLADRWGAANAVLHIEVLRGVFWEAALEELRDPSPRLLADLSDRLAFVCATVLASALSESTQQFSAQAGAATRECERVLFSAPTSASGRSGAVLIDELEPADEAQLPMAFRRREDDEASIPGHGDRRGASAAAAEPQTADSTEETVIRAAPRPLPWDTPLEFSSGPVEEPACEPPQTREQDPVMRVSRGHGTPVDGRH
ncbi:MAG TPA: hypothetical protein VK774_02255 [Solirubrobacteraceae bacterium]|nr:hypothetical protein [Solirubrobacteraceae bacterium]